jgi:hypothetical protein
MKFSKKFIIVFFLLIIFVLFIILIWNALTFENKAEGIPSVSWLPEEATGINYYFSYNNNVYEFSISEDGFLKWVKDNGYENKGWQDFNGIWKDHTSRIVYRYNYFGKQHVDLNQGTVEIIDGVFIEKRQRNGGGYTVGYDRKTRRAYFQSSRR